MIRDGFKAHRTELGPKLGQSVAAGLPRLARLAMGGGGHAERVEAARARVRAEIEARRAAGTHGISELDADAAKLELLGQDAGPTLEELGLVAPAKLERSGAEQGTGANASQVKPVLVQSPVKRGRPKVEGVRPWEAEGVSRRTWERRRKAGGG